MDVFKALRELYAEKKQLDRAITTLEAKLRASATPQKTSPRGRRSMSAAERQVVSQRMTSYWAAKRAAATAGKEDSEPQQPPIEASRISA